MATEDTEVRVPSFAAKPSMKTWRASLRHFKTADAAYEKTSQEQDAAEEQVSRTSPLPAALKTARGFEHRSEQSILSDPWLSFDKKVELVAAVRGWAPRWEAACSEHRTEECEKACEAAHEAMDEALERMALTPAPNLRALLVKTRALINRRITRYIGEHADSAAFVSRLLTDPGDPSEVAVIHIYRDLLRLVGEASPALEADRFDATAWIVEFEREPHHEASQYGVVHHDENGSGTSDRSMWTSLLDWQKDVVKGAAKHRDEKLSEAGAAGRGFYAKDCLSFVCEGGGQLKVEQGELVLDEGSDFDRFWLVPVRRHLASNHRARMSVINALNGSVAGAEFIAAE